MEGGSESEVAVFESLNLNPQMFINETLNSVDDLLDEAFHFFSQEASKLLKTEGTDRSQYLSEGIAHIRNKIQSDLDTRLGMWEKYCLRHCFAVPKGFSLPKFKGRDESPDESLTQQDVLGDPDLDMQLDSLRDRLAMVEKESRGLNHELEALERESASGDHSAALSEILQLYEQNSANDMFQEMVRTASELRAKMEKLRIKRTEDMKKKIANPKRDLSTLNYAKGLSKTKLEQLEEFLAALKNM